MTIKDATATAAIPAMIETSALADVLDQLGFPNQVVARSIVAMTPANSFSGTAACVAFSPLDGGVSATASPNDDFSSIDALARDGVVLVLHVESAIAGAVMGGFMGREYKRRGAAAAITNGVVRDVTELGTLGLPVFASGACPTNGARRLKVKAVGTSVVLPGVDNAGVAVASGDFIVGDSDGIVVIPGDIAAEVIQAAIRVSEVERLVRLLMDAGVPRIEALAAHDRFGHVSSLRERLARAR